MYEHNLWIPQKKRSMDGQMMDKRMFDDVIVFSMSEPGAMGPNDMTFYTKTGEYFTIDYKSDETPYTELREAFPLLKECGWNGPAKGEEADLLTIVIGGASDDIETHVPLGWKHIYLDFGNHLAVKEEVYDEVVQMLKGYDNCDITFGWIKILEEKGFAKNE